MYVSIRLFQFGGCDPDLSVCGDVFSGLVQDFSGILISLQTGQSQPELQNQRLTVKTSNMILKVIEIDRKAIEKYKHELKKFWYFLVNKTLIYMSVLLSLYFELLRHQKT